MIDMPLRDELSGFLKLPTRFFGIPEPQEGDPDVAVLGVPYDLTSSYAPGCRFGPDALRRATTSERSHSQAVYVDCGMSDGRQPMLSECITLEDLGDLEIDLRPPQAALIDISDAMYRLAPHGTGYLLVGGDHFVTYPALRGLRRGHPAEYGLVWFDAHADFYPDYGGVKLSHATTLRRIIEDGLIDPHNIVAVDLRAALREQAMELERLGAQIVSDQVGLEEALGSLVTRIDALYVTVDLDVLSPELVPGVSHPEGGGPSLESLFRMLHSCFRTGMVRATDIVELNPLLDGSGLTRITARDVVRSILSGFALQKAFKERQQSA